MYTADQALMHRWVRERDAQAFKALTSKYGGTVYGVCMRILRNSSDAEDVTQQCFIALANTKDQMPDSMGAWLHRIATHQAINHRRSDQRRRAREERFARDVSAVTEAQWDDVSQFVDEAINELPDKLRTTIVAHFIEDQTITAIAAQENVTHGAISQRVQKGVLLIREGLNRRGIAVTAAALAALLAESTIGAPVCSAALTQSLGKIALSGGALGKSMAPPLLTTTKVLASVAIAAVITLGALFLLPSARTPSADAANIDGPAAPAAAPLSGPRMRVQDPAQAETAPAAQNNLPRVPAAGVPAADTTETIKDWRDVVNAYAAHQDKIRCISVEFKHSTIGDNYYAAFGYPAGHREAFQRGVLTTDGDRCYMEQYRWGNWSGNDTTPIDRPEIMACVWDGDTMIEYSAGGGQFYGRPGWIQVHRDALKSRIADSAFRDGRSYLLFSRYGNAAMLGYPLDNGVRMEEVLRNARTVTLRANKERVANAECYVLDAETIYGVFAVWFDPSHAFNIAQYSLHQRPGDINGKLTVASDRALGYMYTAQQFADIDGLWVPKESTLRIQRLVNGAVGDDHTHHHVRTRIALNKGCNDDETYALHADYILDGSEWTEFGRNAELVAKYTWRDGQLYTPTGQEAQGWPKPTGGGYTRGTLIVKQ